MTALTRTPQNPNFLQPNKFQLNFSRLPNVQFFGQMVTVPGISMGEAYQPTPFIDLYAPGDKAIYDLLNITFYIDEQLKSWIEIHDWIRAMTFPKNFDEYRNIKELNAYTKYQPPNRPQYSDCTVTILSSANSPVVTFKYHDVFPISLSTFLMNTTESPDSPITADASFRYSYFDIIQKT
jgi:hypothetical protein